MNREKIARELIRVAKSLVAYRGGPIRTDRNFVKDMAKKIQWIIDDQDKKYDVGGSWFGEEADPHVGYAGGIYVEDIDDVYVKIPLKDLYQYTDLDAKEFTYRLKSDLKKIIKEVNSKRGVDIYVELPGVEGFETGIKVLVDSAKIQGGHLILKISGYYIQGEVMDEDLESHISEALSPW